jgi:hypothetical protein
MAEVIPAIKEPTPVAERRQLTVKQISATEVRMAAERHFMVVGKII